MIIINDLRAELKENADEKTKAIGQRFFKEEVTFYGVKTSVVHNLVKKYWDKIKNLEKEEIFKLCEELLETNINEEAWIAFDWAD